MSNTGYKNISKVNIKGHFYYKVTVQWCDIKHTAYVPIQTPSSLPLALATRTNFELTLNKPRTEQIIRSHGTFMQRIGKSDQVRELKWQTAAL